MLDIKEKVMPKLNGAWPVLAAIVLLSYSLVAFGLSIQSYTENFENAVFVYSAVAVFVLVMVCIIPGFIVVQPNEARLFNLFGTYTGTIRDQGFWWANPFTVKKKISLRARNFASPAIKVNDLTGNPIEIGAVVVWRVVDSAKAVFSVERYEEFVSTQSETAIRYIASHFPYDSHEDGAVSLRANQDEIARALSEQLEERLQIAGVSVVEARLSHLAYAAEIAQIMLRRQQAAAILGARKLIVEGAVGMVQLALKTLEEQGIVKLDDERRAAMVNNLLVALVSESEAQPVINTGTLYS